MATLVPVTDPGDPRLADYRDLRDVQLRTSMEAEHGLFLAEGEKVVRRAVEAGFPPRSFLMAPRWLPGLADVLDRLDALVLEAEGRLYLAKDSPLAAADVGRMYPEIDRWRGVRRRVDPDGVFTSDLARRLAL